MISLNQVVGIESNGENRDCLQKHSKHSEIVIIVKVGRQNRSVSCEYSNTNVVSKPYYKHPYAVAVFVFCEMLKLKCYVMVLPVITLSY